MDILARSKKMFMKRITNRVINRRMEIEIQTMKERKVYVLINQQFLVKDSQLQGETSMKQ